ncbi:hypothetical protein [Stenotrophomonas maltophilia]|nr:hypothetical protein [Stenotrophomonas maltophilia]
MSKLTGVELDGSFSPFMRCCIGIAIVLVAAAPLAYALQWIRWW